MHLAVLPVPLEVRTIWKSSSPLSFRSERSFVHKTFIVTSIPILDLCLIVWKVI